MFCLNCGAQLPPEANFCYKCANPVSVDFESQTIHARRVVPVVREDNLKSSQNSREIFRFIVSALLLAGLVVGGFSLMSFYQEEQKKQEEREARKRNAENQQMANIELPAPIPAKKPKPKKTVEQIPEQVIYSNTNSSSNVQSNYQTVVNDTFAVNAGQYRYYKFDLETNSQVVGRVEASGGSNDIDTIVMDADEFTNFQNRGAFRSYYHSGYTTIGKIDLNLSAGLYYVVFSNSNALFTNKVVKAKVEIQ